MTRKQVWEVLAAVLLVTTLVAAGSSVYLRYERQRRLDAALREQLGKTTLGGSYDRACLWELLQRGANPRVTAPSSSGSQIDLLTAAILTGDLEAARHALSAGIPPKPPGKWEGEQLLLAARQGKAEMLWLLVEAGLNLEARDPQGRTPLHLSVRTADSSTNTLLTAGAQPNARDSQGQSPLMHAVQANSIVQVACLFHAGAQIDLADKQGNTPLMYAAKQSDTLMVRQLLEAGADPHLRNKRGETALTWAARAHRQPSIFRLLQRYAARSRSRPER